MVDWEVGVDGFGLCGKGKRRGGGGRGGWLSDGLMGLVCAGGRRGGREGGGEGRREGGVGVGKMGG